MSLRTYYAVVTQWDCDPTSSVVRDGTAKPEGPLLMETYLNQCERIADAEAALKRFTRYGWARLAIVIVDVPDAAP